MTAVLLLDSSHCCSTALVIVCQRAAKFMKTRSKTLLYLCTAGVLGMKTYVVLEFIFVHVHVQFSIVKQEKNELLFSFQ